MTRKYKNYFAALIFAVALILGGAFFADGQTRNASGSGSDWKLTQKTKVGDQGEGQITTIYQKGVRQRRETKIDMGMSASEANDPEVAAMMAQMGTNMPTFPITVSQCDLKQDLFLNEKSKAYFIDYYDWSSRPPEKIKSRPNEKMVIKGTVTTDTFMTDSGKRQQMFGLSARWLKVVQTIETSADSCDGASSIRMEQEGWFVTLSLESESCPVQRPPAGNGGCRPKVIVKRNQNPGIMITGTMRMFESGKLSGSFDIETLELSKATLDQALFDVPNGFEEVDSMSELMNKRGPIDTSAKTVFADDSKQKGGTKTIAIDFFSGNSSKIDQTELRSYISGKVTDAGMSGFPINSQSELAGGTFANVIGVEITKLKESGASKIGGLFGKVTGTEGAAALGNSSAEIVVTIYGKDGKTVVASSPARAEVKGKGSDAVKAAIDQVISGLLSKIK